MTITEKFRESKAFYVAAGAGDLAVEKLREVPERLNRLQERTPKDLPGAAITYVNHVGARAVEVVDELAERGKKIVGRVERQQATKQLEESARSTVRKVRSAAGSARQTAKTAGRAASDASKKVGN